VSGSQAPDDRDVEHDHRHAGAQHVEGGQRFGSTGVWAVWTVIVLCLLSSWSATTTTGRTAVIGALAQCAVAPRLGLGDTRATPERE
jgi:hypothetical protein